MATVAGARFVYNVAVEGYLRSSPILEPALSATIKEKEALAKSIAPIDTGAFQGSITGEVVYEGGLIRGRLSSDIAYAPYLEYGTSDTPTFATLRRALGMRGAGGSATLAGQRRRLGL